MYRMRVAEILMGVVNDATEVLETSAAQRSRAATSAPTPPRAGRDFPVRKAVGGGIVLG